MTDSNPVKPSEISKQKRKKLPQLPQNAKVEKRPLLRPAIPSPYAGAGQQKIVYVASHTPFLSAVKRVEKLLHLADKRLVQSATTNAQDTTGARGKRKRGAGGDEILGIAEEVERLKGNKRKKGGGINDGEDGDGQEEVVIKGTGKAIHRVLELALWFQQRSEEYAIRLTTGSVGAIDDVTVDEDSVAVNGASKDDGSGADAVADAPNEDAMDVDEAEHPQQAQEAAEGNTSSSKSKRKRKRKGQGTELAADEVPETRVRYASVLAVAVSLR